MIQTEEQFLFRRSTVIVAALLVMAGCFRLLWPLLTGNPLTVLAAFDDDAYYYFKIAQNIAEGRGSTFNGLVTTNGYHPLWMTCLVALHSIGAWIGIEFLALVRWLLAGLYVAFLAASLALAMYLAPRKPLLRIAFVVACACFYQLIASGGMEIALTLPLLAALLLLLVRGASLVAIAGTATTVVLSRLDSAILIAPLLIYVAWQRRAERRGRWIGIGLASGTIGVYLVLNYLLYGTMVPVSGLAKNAMAVALFDPEPWASIFRFTVWKRMNLLLILLAVIVTLGWAIHRGKGRDAQMWHAGMQGYWLYFLGTALRSAWPLWPWYFFGGFLVLCGALNFAAEPTDSADSRAMPRPLAALGRALLILVALYSTSAAFVSPLVFHRTGTSPSVAEATALARYVDANPGVYAMGDQAGLVSYLAKSPVVQLEGLVMDLTFLSLMRDPTWSMDMILTRYGVTHYIGPLAPGSSSEPCYRVREPAFGGELTPHKIGLLCGTRTPPAGTGTLSVLALTR